MKTYYAICDANGPISCRIDAQDVEDAVKLFNDMDHRFLIDDCTTDAEDDLDINGANMTIEGFESALEMCGFSCVKDLTRDHLYGGWYLWEENE